jgi:hypothetical protein
VASAVAALAAIGISTVPSGHPEPPRETPAPPEWADLALPQQIGDVRVAVASVAIGTVPLEGLLDEAESSEPLLMVRLTIENASRTRKIDFRGFEPELAAVHFAQLTDNFNNAYRRVGFGAARPKGQVRLGSIYPGDSLDDLLVFELPVAAVAYLRLELPAQHVGHDGAYRFQIPCAAIAR